MQANHFDLTGKKALVTGGGQGIGRILALGLAAYGASVAIIDVNQETAGKVAQEIEEMGVASTAVTADVTKPDQINSAVQTIAEKLGGLDIALNNAGVVTHVPALEMTYEQWQQVVDINLTGVFLCAQAEARIMAAQKAGSIINTASMSASVVNVPQPQCSYNASKAGVVQLTKSLAVEWAPYNVRVNCISPGYIQTEMTGSIRSDWKDVWMERSVMKRMGVPEDLVAAVVMLAGDSAAFTTGSEFIMDGGFTCA